MTRKWMSQTVLIQPGGEVMIKLFRLCVEWSTKYSTARSPPESAINRGSHYVNGFGNYTKIHIIKSQFAQTTCSRMRISARSKSVYRFLFHLRPGRKTKRNECFCLQQNPNALLVYTPPLLKPSNSCAINYRKAGLRSGK